MNFILIIIVGIIVILIIVLAMLREYIKNETNKLSNTISNIPSYYYEKNKYGQNLKNIVRFDIPNDLSNSFENEYISNQQKQDFINHYEAYYQEIYPKLIKLESFKITPSETISKFCHDYESINELVNEHNNKVISILLETYQEFFDHCLTYPLDMQQRRSIVSEEENCLVISSAGSGKTSSIVGKVKYLTEIKGIDPERILLISYTHKAAAELTTRMATPGLIGLTFHKLAINIISKATEIKPTICDNTESLITNIYHELIADSTFKKNVLKYFIDYQIDEPDDEYKIRKKLSEQKKSQLKSFVPDMDGNIFYVKSKQEQKICLILSSLGVKFKYEEPYEHQLSDSTHSQYKPDFSIYYEDGNETKRIYLEHFGIDEYGNVAHHFAEENNTTQEEANKKYNDGISWKKATHQKFNTTLLITTSANFHQSEISEFVRKLLIDAGVPINENTEDLYNLLLPINSRQESAFIRLVSSFVALLKSSCKAIYDILEQAKNAYDNRSVFIIENIFQPVYERYKFALLQRNELDFTDAILLATQICRNQHLVSYDYIIVDEFQDISIDRYKFLKALREANPTTKLYCVGDDWQSIYRFSGSDMSLFNQFPNYFGATDINKIETTYRFCEPLVSLSSDFIQRNSIQIRKNIHSFNSDKQTDLLLYAYNKSNYCTTIKEIVSNTPADKTILLLGRYSFDDYYLSKVFQSIKEGNRFFYLIEDRKIEFLTIHKSKGLEADYVIILQCNNDSFGFPSIISDDPVLNYVLTTADQYPFGEERRLFYVAITRAKVKTHVLYDKEYPSIFVNELLNPEKTSEDINTPHRNANKRWTAKADKFLLQLHYEGKSIKYISNKMGRSQTSIIMRLEKLKQ